MYSFIEEKGQELSFVLIRVSGYIRRFDLRKRVENLAYNLVENISYRNHELSLSTIDAIAGFVTLGKNVYEIEPINAKVLLRELDYLKQEIIRISGSGELSGVEQYFKVQKDLPKMTELHLAIAKAKEQIGKINLPKQERVIDTAIRQSNQAMRESDNNVAIRQEAIISKIAGSPERKLQLKDIIAGFPGVSERTIRYDLKKLHQDGKLQREGKGGPGNFYIVQAGIGAPGLTQS